MGLSVDGLVTGMSTTDTIKQLMQVEAIPQTALKTKVGVQNKILSAYQSLNTRMSSLATAAKTLGSADTWGAVKATSSSSAAVVTASPGAAAGSLVFRVDTLVATQTTTFAEPVPPITSISDADLSPVISGADFYITLTDGSSWNVVPDDASLQSVVDAINDTTDAAYKATIVQINPGEYTLQLTSKTAGADGVFAHPTIDLLGAALNTTEGTDAQITVGSDPLNEYQITSATNTFADVISGVTVTAVRAQDADEAPITVGLAADVDGIAAKVQALVDSANLALTEIASQTKIKSGDVAAGALVGDSAIRRLGQQIVGAVSAGAAGLGYLDSLGGLGGLGSFQSVGVGLDRSGKLTFDKEKFTESYTADPTNTKDFFAKYTDENDVATDRKFEPGWHTATGLGRKLETVALLASDGVSLPADSTSPTKSKQGLLEGLIQRRTDSISKLNDQVSDWDVRLDLRMAKLQRQFSNLEVAMGKMKSQSSWLAGQLATLS